MSDIKPFNAFNGRSVLITGGLGFIGSNLAHRLVELGNVKVTLLDNLLPEQGGNPYNIASLGSCVDTVIGDMGDADLVRDLVGGIDYVFNLAGSAGHVDSMHDPSHDLEMNCRAQLSLLETCRRFNPQVKVIFTSTRQVYGKPMYLPVDEDHRISPLDINGANKFAAESYHLIFNRVYGLRTVCLRLTNTYGPRQLLHHDRQGFIPWFIRKAIDGETIDLFGGGNQRRDMNHVDDVIDALLTTAASELAEGEIFNLGGERVVTLREFASELTRVTGSGTLRSIPFPENRQHIDMGNVYSSFTKIKTMLGWEPKVDLRTGLQRTIEFYRQNREHYWNRETHSFSRYHKAA